jgi:hypothetical protein
MAVVLFSYSPVHAQEKKKTVPDGTEGVVLTIPPVDSMLKKTWGPMNLTDRNQVSRLAWV